jgi:hypothetical protein
MALLETDGLGRREGGRRGTVVVEQLAEAKSKMSCSDRLSDLERTGDGFAPGNALLLGMLAMPDERIDDGFPLGSAALHPDWPDARFNVSGMFAWDPGIVYFLRLTELRLGCRVGIEAVHGAPFVLWNGGRLNKSLEFDPAGLSARLESLYAQGVGCFLTFTNQLLDAGDLDDAQCNFLLDSIALRPELNGVIVGSDLLSESIARRHPGLRQIASVTKVVAERGRGKAAYYKELGKRFYRYVVHLDDYQDRRLLDQLDRTKAEIILNENCLRDCPRRARHYELTARMHKLFVHRQAVATGGSGDALLRRAEQELQQFLAECPMQRPDRRAEERGRTCNVTRNELKSLYHMGFRHFKIQGRDNIPFCFAYDLTRYTLEPGFAAPYIYKQLCQVILPSLAAAQARAR